jgi:hypothetical protein
MKMHGSWWGGSIRLAKRSLTCFLNETGRPLRRSFEGRKDEKAFAARPDGDGSVCVRRGGNGDRRPVLAVLDGRVTACAIKANEAKKIRTNERGRQLRRPTFYRDPDRDDASGVSQRVGASDNGTNCEVLLQREHLYSRKWSCSSRAKLTRNMGSAQCGQVRVYVEIDKAVTPSMGRGRNLQL